MISRAGHSLHVAIACGGTGGHLFPGLAVAEQLAARGASVTLMISAKEVDQQAARAAEGMSTVTLPAIGLSRGRVLAFTRAFRESYKVARNCFNERPPQAVLAMGGFTSAPPLLAAKRLKAPTFLHESNTIPGRANRWLSWLVERAFVGFPSAINRLHARRADVTGTPVRASFSQLDPGTCRQALGLDPARPVALVMGGSQGACGINDLVIRSLPLLAKQGPEWQWFHLAGPTDVEKLRSAYQAHKLRAFVHAFFLRMDQVMGAATAAISRAGASSLAEIAAIGLPAVLIPYPAATDNHQLWNARAFEQSGAACLVEQRSASPEDFVRCFGELMREESVRQRMRAALAAWHKPGAADAIAQAIFEVIGMPSSSIGQGLTAKDSGSAGDTPARRSQASALPGHRKLSPVSHILRTLEQPVLKEPSQT